MSSYQKHRPDRDSLRNGYKSPERIRGLFQRYKKTIIVWGVAVASLLTLGTVGLGYLAYQAVTVSVGQMAALKQNAADLIENKQNVKLAPPEVGVVGSVVTQVASDWFMQAIQNSDVGQIHAGLSCLDALGAPSPQDMVQLVKSNITDSRWIGNIEKVESQLNKLGVPQGVAACSHWLLRG